MANTVELLTFPAYGWGAHYPRLSEGVMPQDEGEDLHPPLQGCPQIFQGVLESLLGSQVQLHTLPEM